MNDQELEKFEQQLRQIKPAAPPEEFTARLVSARPMAKVLAKATPPNESRWDHLRVFRRSLRWLIPATALVLGAAVVWRGNLPSARRPADAVNNPHGNAPVATTITADDVKIDQQLVSSFDAVARLPSGESVRFRCENWMDQVVLSDKSQGVVFKNRTPRLEIVAVGYDTY